MRDLDRLSVLAREVNAYSENRLQPEDIVRRDSIAPLSNEAQVDARKKLVLQKTGSVYYKDPSKQKRNILRGKDKKNALKDTESWTYTKAERYAVLDAEIRQGGPSSLAQAILSFDMGDLLDVNVTYVADSSGQAICTGKQNGWLELIAGRNGPNDVAFIRLLANFGASQASLDRALSIALQSKAMRIIDELFMNGADPNSTGVPNHFLAAIREQNKSLYTFFLTAPVPLNIFYINQALVEALGRDPHLVAILIAHGADGMSNDGQALCTAVNMKSQQETAMILANPGAELSVNTLDLAADAACVIEDENIKSRFLEMLFCAGANVNTAKIKDELLVAVKKDQTALVKLLIDHGTSPDRNEAEALRIAILSGQSEVVQILLVGPVPEASTSRALDEASGLEDSDAFEEIVRALVEKGVSKSSLRKCLAVAVDKERRELALFLVKHGATLDYDRARCIRKSLKRSDFGLVGSLLQEANCEPAVLCEALPDATKVQPPSARYGIMITLLNKGVSGKQLHVALQNIAATAKDPTDYALIQALMAYKASVDYVDKKGNSLCTAAAQLNEKALDLLCQGDPSPDTASNAIAILPVSFATSEAMEYEQQVGMMTTLLEKGACGTHLAELLIKAVRDDYREKALTALVRHGADPNYQNGKAVEEAIKLSRTAALELLCNDCKIAKNSFAAQLPNALSPVNFSFEKARILVHASQDYDYESLLDQPLLDEVVSNGARKYVIELLLNLGANVNFQNGGALQHAVRHGKVEVCSLLLGAGVQHANIALAFPSTSGIADQTIRYNLMQALLEAGGSGIGQDEALIQASQEAPRLDLSHVELLLQNHASANFSNGTAVIESIKTNNLPLLKRFVETELNKDTLERAFNLTRKKKKCTEEDRYNIFETLLQVYSDEDMVSLALIEAVLRDAQDTKLPVLLLNHGASLDLKNAHAMCEVACKGSLELLSLCISMQPSQAARDTSFQAATCSSLSTEVKIPVYRSLLETGITLELVSAALLEATVAEVVDRSLLTMLIEFKASLDFDSGNALFGIVKRGDLSTLNVLLTGFVEHNQPLDRSFSAAMNLDGPRRLEIAKGLLEKKPGVSLERISGHLAQVVQQNDYDLLSLMMDYKPNPGFNCGESLILAAGAGDARSTELLTRAEVPTDIVNGAFEQLLNTCAIRSNLDGGLRTAEILLALGIEQHLVDRALLDAFDDKVDQLTKDVVELLMQYTPNVNGGDGKLFVDMARISDEALFRRLAAQKPNLNIVITALIRSIDNEEELISFLVHLEECAERGLTALDDAVIFTALKQFPDGRLLVKHLLNNGCSANSKVVTTINPTLLDLEETMTVLIWALVRRDGEPTISEAVIMEILEVGHGGLKEEHNAEVEFQTDSTHISAMILVSATGQNDILIRLLEISIDLSQRDIAEHSALFYASKMGHLDTVEILIDAGAPADDGSLHEAVREGHHLLAKVLMEKKHRVDFPSSIHADGTFGRTPLEELCLNAISGAANWQKNIHESISLILPAKVADIPTSSGKTILHLALENKRSSVDVTRELLSFPFVWENINDPVYLYTDEQGYVYSPTKYVELLLEDTDPSPRQQLIKLLHSRKCKDRFFANIIAQPSGAVGLPEEVAAAVNKQKRADHEKLEELKRREEIATKQRELDTEDHRRNQELSRQAHELQIRQIKEQERIDAQVASDKQDLIMRHAQELQRKTQEGLAAENRLRNQGLAEEAVLRKRVADEEYAAEMTRRRGLLSAERDAQAQRLAAEQQIVGLRASAANEAFRREREMCDYRLNAAKKEAQHRREAASYN